MKPAGFSATHHAEKHGVEVGAQGAIRDTIKKLECLPEGRLR
ncbi:hypothetical protein [Actinophytocola xinjiangensis]|nr:hypothetical protein [Actinophytocola xinjiangensis]